MQANKKHSKIPYIFLVFFLVVFSVDITYIYLSKKTWRGVVTEDSYQKGIKYNETISRIKRQQSLGWKVEVSYVGISSMKGIMDVGVVNQKGNIISDADVYVIFKRPTQSGFDFKILLEFVNNVYKSEIDFPLKGQWDAEVVIIKGKDSFQLVKRYVIQ